MCFDFLFFSGCAQYILSEKDINYNLDRYKRLRKFIIQFWIILILFSLIGLIVGSKDIPVNLPMFLENLFLYRLSYNGAWWFVLSYIFLILLFPIMKKMIENINPIIVVILSGCIYFGAYFFEILHPLSIENSLLEWIYTQLCLLGRTQLPFIIGSLCVKYQIIEKIKDKIKSIKFKNLILIMVVLTMFIGHAIVQSMIVAPFTGLITLLCFHLWEKPEVIQKIFYFLGKHSTNIWFTHMFFYMVLFKDLIFKLKEPILIAGGMFLICIIVSYSINIIESFLYKVMRIK